MNKFLTTADIPSESVVNYRRGLILLLLISTGFYFLWRPSIMNPQAPVTSLVFLLLELIGVIWGVFFVGMSLHLSHRNSEPAPAGMKVDVFITTFNEPISIVEKTLMAAVAIYYPHQTWLLDDGNRPEMRDLADAYGCNYLARFVNTDAKAGNLNHGLANTSGDFILILDADHIACPDFLDHTLSYFTDEKVAFVQTPQEFYNFDSFQHMGADRSISNWNEHSLFHRVIQRERDLVNATMFSGTGAILRRKALEEIGGFATGTVTEDMHTSVKLHARGWYSVFHAETLSVGLAPTDARSYKRQRLRWAQGAMQVFIQEKLLTCEGLSRSQRIAYLSHVMAHFAGWRTLLLVFFPSIVLMANISPLQVSIGMYLKYVIPYLFINIFVFEELARGHGHFFRNEVHNLARCIPSIMAVFYANRRKLNFLVTPKVPQEWVAHIVFLPWLIVICSLLGLVIAWLRLPTLMSASPEIAVMSLWALYPMVTAASLLKINHRCFAKSGVEPLFSLEKTAHYSSFNASIVSASVKLIGIASDRATIQFHSPPLLDSGSQLTFRFSLDSREWVLRGILTHLQDCEGEVRWVFESDRKQAEFAVDVTLCRLYLIATFDKMDHETRVVRWFNTLNKIRRLDFPGRNRTKSQELANEIQKDN